MSVYLFAAIWIAALSAAVPLVARTRHPALKPIEAYALFVVGFSVAALIVFGGAAWTLETSGLAMEGGGSAAVVLAGAAATAAGLLAGRRLIRLPPGPDRHPDGEPD